MSVFKTLCTGLMLATISFAAHAASRGSTDAQGPDQVPSEIEIDVKNTREVIQVLYVSNASEIKIANLVRERNPDADLRHYADDLAREHAWMNSVLRTIADIKSISLEEGELEDSAQLVGTMMDEQLQSLAAEPQERFRSAFLVASIMAHQKTLELFSRIEQGNSDDALKATVAISRQLVEKHLAEAQRLKAATQQPAQPVE